MLIFRGQLRVNLRQSKIGRKLAVEAFQDGRSTFEAAGTPELKLFSHCVP